MNVFRIPGPFYRGVGISFWLIRHQVIIPATRVIWWEGEVPKRPTSDTISLKIVLAEPHQRSITGHMENE
jgi:hypothetical protein